MAISAHDFYGLSGAPARADAHTERTFFSDIRLSNGTAKTTWPNRFDDLDKRLTGFLEDAGIRPGEVLDCAVSAGTGTVELANRLNAAGHAVRLTGTDLSLEVELVEAGRNFRFLREKGGHLLQAELFGLAIRPWNRRRDFLNGRFILSAVARAAYRAFGRDASGQSLQLLSPAALAASSIAFREADLFAPPPGDMLARFDLVRAMNILNLAYFDDATLRTGIARLAACMRGPGSLLLIGRTITGHGTDATLFRMTEAGGFEVAFDFNAGSEISNLVLAHRPETHS